MINASWLPRSPGLGFSARKGICLNFDARSIETHFEVLRSRLGALGIVTQLTLDIEPTYDMTQWVRLGIPLDELENRLNDVFSAGYSVSAFANWLSGEAALWLKCRVDEPDLKCASGTAARHSVQPSTRYGTGSMYGAIGGRGALARTVAAFPPHGGRGNGK